MKLTYNWILKHLSKKITIEEVKSALDNLSIEIDSIQKLSGENYYVAQVINKEIYTDKLNIVTVKYEVNNIFITKDVICGADNVEIGMYTILVTEGAILPNNIKITERNIKGFKSTGMLLSYEEFGLKHLHFNGIINESKEFLQELIKEDYIINISLSANRIDISSIMGLSREIGNYYNIHLKSFDNTANHIEKIDNNIKVHMEDDVCDNFQTMIINNISINNNYYELLGLLCKIFTLHTLPLININNFIIKDLGIPLHIYDINKSKELNIIKLKHEEEFITLKEDKLLLNINDIVIKNENNDTMVVAGLIGSNKYKINENTNNILIEIGIFNREYLIPTSNRLNILTDSSYYNKRGINYNNYLITLNYIKHFINGDFSKINIIKHTPKQINEFFLSYEKFYKISNLSLSLDNIKKILEQYEYKVEVINKSSDINLNNQMGLLITPPLWKCYIVSEASIIEDIIRISNLSIDKKLININPLKKQNINNIDENLYNNIYNIKNYLVNMGLNEIITYTFSNKGTIELLNPIFNEEKFFRESLIDHMEKNILNILNNKDYMNYMYGNFEISKVFIKNNDNVIEYYNLCIGVIKKTYHYGFDNMGTYIKNIIYNIGIFNKLKIIFKDENIKNEISIYINGFKNGYIKIFNEYYILEIINLDKLISKIITVNKKEFIDNNINYSIRDYSFTYDKLYDEINNTLLKIKNITFTLFDVFKDSYTIRCKILSQELDIKDKEIIDNLSRLNVVFR